MAKCPAALPKSLEFQVWIWRRFLPVTGSKGSCYTTVKATKPLADIVVTWNCFAHFLWTGLGRLVSKLLRSVCTDNFFAHSSWRASLTWKLLRWRFLHFVCAVRSTFCSVFLYVPFRFRMVWPLRFLSVVVPFFDKTVNRKTIVFLKRNVNFLLTGTVHARYRSQCSRYGLRTSDM